MAKNIQLELLAKFGQNITTKRIFLYEANPAEEPVYITISELAEQLNALLGSGDVTLDQFIQQVGTVSSEITTINRTLGSITTSQTAHAKVINELQTALGTVSGTVDNLLKTVNTHSTDISSIKQRVSNAESSLSTLKSSVDTMKQQITQIQKDIQSAGDDTSKQLEKLAWKHL